MKVLFIARTTLFSSPGGDTVQIESTAKYLRILGVQIDVRLSNERLDYTDYDLLHFFNIIRPSDILYHVNKSNKPYLISTIFVDYREYDKKNRGRFVSGISRFLSIDHLEYLKTIIRYFKNGEPISSKSYLWKGHRNSILELLQNASCLLPNSESEYKRLQKEYGISQHYKVIPNAIDLKMFNTSKGSSQNREGIICVARIEGLKNQLNLIRAFKDKPQRLILIGKPGPNHYNYYQTCKEEASQNVTFIDHISQEELISYYTKAKVHVLPSWFETTGLSSLEAAYMGCNIVVTGKGDTREYFKDFAYYCNPEQVSSIYSAVMKAYDEPYNKEFKEYIEESFRWDITAEKTFEAYREVLQNLK